MCQFSTEPCVPVTVDSANTFAGKYEVFGRQETRLREGFPSRIAAGGGGIYLIRPFADRTRQEQCPRRAGDPTRAAVPCHRARQRPGGVKTRRRAPDHAGARAGPSPRYTSAERRRESRPAARSRRKDRTADSAEIVHVRPVAVIPGRARARTRNPEIGLRRSTSSGFRVWPGACHRAARSADPLGPSRNDAV
jgi:hypothetical protein